jgi:hypothetical protein
MEKNIQNKQSSVTSIKVVEMDDEELNVLDVLEEASVARYQMLPTKSKLRYQKEFGKIYTNGRPRNGSKKLTKML